MRQNYVALATISLLRPPATSNVLYVVAPTTFKDVPPRHKQIRPSTILAFPSDPTRLLEENDNIKLGSYSSISIANDASIIHMGKKKNVHCAFEFRRGNVGEGVNAASKRVNCVVVCIDCG